MPYDKLPSSLKEEPYFCLYKLELDGKGKKKKVPNQVNGARVDPGEKAHLTDYKTAYETYQKGGYDGIGLSVVETIFSVDIEHCVVDGKLSDMSEDVLEALKTYAEFSPSGTGVHIWGRAPNILFDRDKYYINNHKVGLEVYIGSVTNEFLTLTGDAINDLDVNDCSKALQVVLDKYMVRPTVSVPTVIPPGSYLSDDSVIAKMLSSKNADNVQALWDGQITDGKSHSEADMSLCMNLAFWCGGDAEQMDRVFRQSVLMRNKWDERHGADTYGNLTIQNAVRQCTEFYKPIGISLVEGN